MKTKPRVSIPKVFVARHPVGCEPYRWHLRMKPTGRPRTTPKKRGVHNYWVLGCKAIAARDQAAV